MEIGSKVGRYEIVSPVGKGGMGEVWCATDTSLGREVALKVLPEAFAGDAERRARFEREAKLLASLNHSKHRHPLRSRGDRRRAPVWSWNSLTVRILPNALRAARSRGAEARGIAASKSPTPSRPPTITADHPSRPQARQRQDCGQMVRSKCSTSASPRPASRPTVASTSLTRRR